MSDDAETPNFTNDGLVPVPIGDIITGLTTPVDVFVKLSDKKHVQIAKAGGRLGKDQIQTYKDKNVEYLWVPRDQYSKLISKNVAIAGIVVQSENLNNTQKTFIVASAAKAVFNELETLGFAMDSYNHAVQVIEATVALVDNHNDLSELFKSLNDCSAPLMRHSMATSALAVIIGHKLGWKNKVTLEKLALGGLLHDIGLKALPPDLIDKPKAKMTYDELQLYETHAFKGMKMLVELGIVPDDIISIVYQHHENSFGQGFPQKLRNLKIHPLARVVALSNEFVNLTIKNPWFPRVLNTREALILIETTMGQPFNKESFLALSRIVNKNNFKQVG